MKKFLTIILLSLTLKACPNQDQRCISCEGTKCKACNYSYLNASGKCIQPSTTVLNCLTYIADGKCSFCKHGFNLQKNTCVRNTIKNCAEENTKGECIMCNEGIRIKDGKCDEVNQCEIPNCDFCVVSKGVEICEICDDDFALKMSANGVKVCQEETDLVEDCFVLGKDGKCLVCRFGYYWNNGSCSESDLSDVTDDMSFVKMNVVVLGILGLFL